VKQENDDDVAPANVLSRRLKQESEGEASSNVPSGGLKQQAVHENQQDKEIDSKNEEDDEEEDDDEQQVDHENQQDNEVNSENEEDEDETHKDGWNNASNLFIVHRNASASTWLLGTGVLIVVSAVGTNLCFHIRGRKDRSRRYGSKDSALLVVIVTIITVGRTLEFEL
jgi:hypothetical protein